MTITTEQIQATLAKYPGTPGYKLHPEAHRQWAVWRIISDKIISNPHYRWDDPKKWPLIRMAEFAAQMMGHYNRLSYHNAEVVQQ